MFKLINNIRGMYWYFKAEKYLNQYEQALKGRRIKK
jgi:hypothetical protein